MEVMYVGWRWGWGGRGWGPWPGRGPFSYLPPWLRPGWIFGRGACWWLFGWPWGIRWLYPYYYGYYPFFGYPTYYAPWIYPYYGPYPWWW